MSTTKTDELLVELAKTRESFDKAISAVRWNRVNTIILYVLIGVVFLLGALFVRDSLSERHNNCERDNALRAAVLESNMDTAAAIGAAIAAVSNASPEQYAEYLEVYRNQKPPEALNPREC